MSPQNRAISRAFSEPERLPTAKVKQKPLFEDSSTSLVVSRILSNSWKSILTSVMVGKGISRSISEEDVHKAATSFSSHPRSFEATLLRKVATFQVGNSWDSQSSSRVRKRFRETIPTYLDDLERIVPLPIQDHRIFATSIVNGVEERRDVFAGFWACAIKKARTKKRGAPVSMLVREFKGDGSVMYVLAKHHGKDPETADSIVDEVADRFRSPEDFKNVETVFDSISDKLAPKTASLFLAIRREGFFTFWSAGNVFVFDADGSLVHHGSEENLLGSNFQRITRKGRRMLFKRAVLEPTTRVLDQPFIVSTVPFEPSSIPLKKSELKKLAKDHHAILSTFA